LCSPPPDLRVPMQEAQLGQAEKKLAGGAAPSVGALKLKNEDAVVAVAAAALGLKVTTLRILEVRREEVTAVCLGCRHSQWLRSHLPINQPLHTRTLANAPRPPSSRSFRPSNTDAASATAILLLTLPCRCHTAAPLPLLLLLIPSDATAATACPRRRTAQTGAASTSSGSCPPGVRPRALAACGVSTAGTAARLSHPMRCQTSASAMSTPTSSG